MTDPDDPADQDAEADDAGSGDRSSSLADLAESVGGRRSGSADVGLDIGDDPDPGSASDSISELNVDVPGDAASALEAVAGASNVLVLGPLRGADANRHCIDLLTHGPADRAGVLFVTVARSADDRLTAWRQFADDPPASMSIVSLGEQTRAPGTSTTVSMQGGPDDITLEGLSDPSDLTRLGITVNKHLAELGESAPRTALCVHSLTALLQYVDPERLYRFLHILQGKLESLDTVAHYHLDPGAHDARTPRVFRTLFDTVVRVADDGTLELVSTPD